MKTIIRSVLSGLVLAGSINIAQADEFKMSFEWGDIPLCTTGSPNIVDNPVFTLSGVPEGTKFIAFRLTDLDVPGYNHGGGTVEYTGQTIIEPGAFSYKSPCPPNGSHTYEWTASADDSDSIFSDTLAKASASVSYP